MTDIVPKPYEINTATLTLGSDTFQKACRRAEAVPTHAGNTFDAIDGASYPLGGTPSWVLNVELAQDWDTASSLAIYLMEHDGEEVTFEYLPTATAVRKITGTLLCRAISMGGQSKAAAVSTVTLPIVGLPTFATVS